MRTLWYAAMIGFMVLIQAYPWNLGLAFFGGALLAIAPSRVKS